MPENQFFTVRSFAPVQRMTVFIERCELSNSLCKAALMIAAY